MCESVYMYLLQVVIALGDYLDTQCHACIGGTNVRTDIMKLELGQHVVVGTPGRVFDMISRRALGRFRCHLVRGVTVMGGRIGEVCLDQCYNQTSMWL